MKFQTLISRASVVLFAAALSLTSCTKDESLVSDFASTSPVEIEMTADEAVVGTWNANIAGSTSGVTFNNGTGSADKGGFFSIVSDGNDYTDFTWRILDASPVKANQDLVLSFGTSEDMKRTYRIQSYTSDQIALSTTNGTVLLNKE